ncbi:MAG: TonB-dependent receptor [Niabella sp.]
MKGTIAKYFNIWLLLTMGMLTEANAQNSIGTITGTVKDGDGRTVMNALVFIEQNNRYAAISDSLGRFSLTLPTGKYTLKITHAKYDTLVNTFHLRANEILKYHAVLTIDMKQLEQVFVTGYDGKGVTSSSIISKEAMKLLQPSSFADLMELLPGGRAQTPSLTSANPIRLRQTGTPSGSSAYDISSLGTGFFIDGAPVNTNANMQTTLGFSSIMDPNESRDMTNKGVDMRTIPTDQIEKVEIIRGIPSVEYGDITSGAVLITRKSGEQPLYARMKADGFSKLFSVGKGFSDKKKKKSLNFDVDFLNALSKPTSNYTNYQRLTTSVRFQKETNKKYGILKWQNAFDYAHNIDNVKPDPENSLAGVDKYSSLYNRYGAKTQLSVLLNRERFIQNVDLIANISYEQDRVNLTKFMQARTATLLVTSLEEGAHEAKYLTPSYVGNLIVDGKPISGYIKLSSNAAYNLKNIRNRLKIGSEFTYTKNFGSGQVYDLNYPVDLSGSVQVGATTRPRAFKDIPAMQLFSIYAENSSYFNLGKHHFTVQAGARLFSLLGISRQYDISGSFHADPRINGRWELPSYYINKKPFQISLTGGWGLLTKTPTLDHLYPTKQYVDLIELNYYHNNPAYRVGNAMTYIIDKTNFNLRHAKNRKWEIGVDIHYNGYRATLTYFREITKDGFRNASLFRALNYKKYDNASINSDTVSVKPSLKDFTFRDITEFHGYSMAVNGSELQKEGIEYQISTKRLTSINTRFTLNGAWFRSTYLNSLDQYRIINSTVVTNDNIRQFVGLYDDDEGSYNEQFNTNLTIDSRIPRLALNIAASFQCRWFTSRQNAFKTGTPIAYMGIDQVLHPYTEADKTDPDLRWLNDPVDPSYFRKSTVPTDLQINLKLSKGFINNKAIIAMFVNKVIVYTPNYYNENNIYIVRQGINNTPYFGMELSFNF